jgi:uncharacterized Zn-binding protein involved in type VI secretion
MIDAIRLDDATDHGGKVVSASSTAVIRGRAVARLGDRLTCPLHPQIEPNLIVQGDHRITDHGVPIARHGHMGTCGCRLISSLA